MPSDEKTGLNAEGPRQTLEAVLDPGGRPWVCGGAVGGAALEANSGAWKKFLAGSWNKNRVAASKMPMTAMTLPIAPSAQPIPDRPRMGRQALVVFGRDVVTELKARHLPQAMAPLFQADAWHELPSGLCDVHLFGALPTPSDQPVHFHTQQGHSFRERFLHAVHSVRALGYERIVVVGGDCPDLRGEEIFAAFAALDSQEAVLGPDHRGGTYLIGLRDYLVPLLDAITWQAHTDFAHLNAALAGHTVLTLRTHIDVDGWRDLVRLSRSDSRWSWLVVWLTHWVREPVKDSALWVDLARQKAVIRQLTAPPFAGV